MQAYDMVPLSGEAVLNVGVFTVVAGGWFVFSGIVGYTLEFHVSVETVSTLLARSGDVMVIFAADLTLFRGSAGLLWSWVRV